MKKHEIAQLLITVMFAIMLVVTFNVIDELRKNDQNILSNQAEFKKSYAKIQATLDYRGPILDNLNKEIMKLKENSNAHV